MTLHLYANLYSIGLFRNFTERLGIMNKWIILQAWFVIMGSLNVAGFMSDLAAGEKALNEVFGYGLILETALVVSVLLWKAIENWKRKKEQMDSSPRYLFFHNMLIVVIFLEWNFLYMIAGNSAGIFQYSVHATEMIKLMVIGIAGITICTAIYTKLLRKA